LTVTSFSWRGWSRGLLPIYLQRDNHAINAINTL